RYLGDRADRLAVDALLVIDADGVLQLPLPQPGECPGDDEGEQQRADPLRPQHHLDDAGIALVVRAGAAAGPILSLDRLVHRACADGFGDFAASAAGLPAPDLPALGLPTPDLPAAGR